MLFYNSTSKCSSDKCYGTAKCSIHSLATALLREMLGCVLPYGESRAEPVITDDLQPPSEWRRGTWLCTAGWVFLCQHASSKLGNEMGGGLPGTSPLA